MIRDVDLKKKRSINMPQRFSSIALILIAFWIEISVASVANTSAEPTFSRNWIIGTPVPQRNIMATFIRQTIDGVKEKTEGTFDIRYLQNFDEQVLTEYLVRGRIQMMYLSATGIGVLIPEAAILNLPFLWESDEERNFVTDVCVLPTLQEVFRRRGIEILRIGEAGWSNIFCKSDICQNAEALEGGRVRVSPNKSSRLFWNKLSTNGISLPLPDTWPALQLGVVDAADLTFSYYLVTPAAQIAPYYFFTRHSHQPAFFVANRKAWLELSANERQVILSSMPTTNEMRNTMDDNEKNKIVEFTEKGGKVFELTDDQLKKYRDRVAPHVPELANSFGGDAAVIYQIIQNGKKIYKTIISNDKSLSDAHQHNCVSD